MPVLLIPAWRWLERTAGADETVITCASRWCLQVLLRRPSVAIVATIAVLLALPAVHESWWLVATPAAAFAALLPVIGLAAAVEAAIDAMAAVVRWSAAPAAVASIVIAVVAVAVAGLILMFSLTPIETVRRMSDLLSRRRVATVFAVHARVLLVSMFVCAPLAVPNLLLWKLVPSHAAGISEHGDVLPWSARAVVILGGMIETSGVILLPFIFGLLLSLLVSRALWLT